MIFEGKFQIGKKGITQGAVDSINLSFKTHTQLRISVLKSIERSKGKIKEMAEELCDKVEFPCNYKIIGFTIILRKRSKKKKQS